MPNLDPEIRVRWGPPDETLTLEGGPPPRPALALRPRRAKIPPPMTDDLQLPKEGLSTLSASFTRDYVEKVLKALKQIRDHGTSEADILRKMEREMRDMDAFSRRRLYEMSRGGPIPDDFPPDAVVDQREPKPGSFVLTVKQVPKVFVVGTLIQHAGKCCCIVRLEVQTLHLKAVR